ncbi:hypothetical protein GVN24_16120 [Rhizobium sp. CRIBSB]|nr:hypothetical protein [Rhizobium sp. CRIBSB]
MPDASIKIGDSPTDRLAKLLPAEVTGVYVSIRSLAETSTYQYAFLIMLSSAVAMAFLSAKYVEKFKNITNTLHKAIYATTFLIWAIALDTLKIDETFLDNTGLFPLIVGIFTLIWTFSVQLAIPSERLS